MHPGWCQWLMQWVSVWWCKCMHDELSAFTKIQVHAWWCNSMLASVYDGWAQYGIIACKCVMMRLCIGGSTCWCAWWCKFICVCTMVCMLTWSCQWFRESEKVCLFYDKVSFKTNYCQYEWDYNSFWSWMHLISKLILCNFKINYC